MAPSNKPLKESLPLQGTDSFAELEQVMHMALETYSNVHRGSGHNSIVTTYLYEQARDIILDFLGLSKSNYVVIFCTLKRAQMLQAKLKPEYCQILSSQDIGLPIGLRALAIKRKALPKGIPFQTGGGTARLVSLNQITWAEAPDKFEAGTPSIINVITFAKVLQIIKNNGNNAFQSSFAERLSAKDILYHDSITKGYFGRKLLDVLKGTLCGGNAQVPTVEGSQPFINLDNGASTSTFNSIWNVVCQTLHQSEDVRQEIIREVRAICLDFLGASQIVYDVIFSLNTTEAINTVAESLSRESVQDVEPVVLSTILEHTSNDLPWRMISNYSVIRLSADNEGFLDLIELENLLCAYNKNSQHGTKRIKLVAITGASNVLGTFNDLEKISRITHEYGAYLLVDAAQMVAHRKVEIEKCGIDYLTFSAHKVYAPFGTGVLVARKGLLNFNASEFELIQSSGEENSVGIAALGKALLLLRRIGMELIQEEEQGLTKRLLQGMSQIPGLKIYGITDTNTPSFTHKGGVVIFSMKGMMPNQMGKELALHGIGVRYGCHCAHLLIKQILNIPVPLQRFQHLMLLAFPKLNLPGVVRVSMGIGNSEKDVDTLIQVLCKIANKHQYKSGKQSSSCNESPTFSKAVVRKQMGDFVKSVADKVYTR